MRITGRIEKYSKDGKKKRIIINMGYCLIEKKYKRKTKVVEGDKPYAQKVMREMIAEIEQQKKPQSEMLLRDWLNKWIEDYANLHMTTHDIYNRLILNHINPTIGHIPISDLSQVHIADMYADKAKDGRLDGKGGLSPSSINQIHAALRTSLSYAVELELISTNPVEKVKPPKISKKKRNHVILSKEQLKKLIEGFKGHRIYPIVYVASFTGMRIGEVLALEWNAIDWKNNTIHIRKNLKALGNGQLQHYEGTKTGQIRTIKVSNDVLEVLKEHRKNTINSINHFIFTDKKGRPLYPSHISRSFKTKAKKVGFEGVRFHDLRHTHATILLNEGVYIKDVSERLGHANVTTTLSVYAHVLPNRDQEVADVFARLMEN